MSTVPSTQNSTNAGYPEFDGELLIGQTGENPINATLTADFGIEITNAAGAITIKSTGQSQAIKITADTQMIEDRNYIIDASTAIEVTLPATMKLGSVFTIVDISATKLQFKILQNALQSIKFGNKSSTVGVAGNIRAKDQNNSLTIMCTTEDVDFSVISAIGNFEFDK